MVGLLTEKLGDQRLKEATVIVGTGTTGVTTAKMLDALGLPTILVEASGEVLPAQAASRNNTGIRHSPLFSSHTETMLHQFAAAIASGILLPKWVEHRENVVFALPENDHTGNPNSALTGIGDDGAHNEKLTLSWAINALTEMYREHLAVGGEPVFGKIEEFSSIVQELDMQALLGETSHGEWLGADGVFQTAYQINTPAADVSLLERHLRRQVASLESSSDAQIYTHQKVTKITQKQEGYEVAVHNGESFKAKNVINACYTNGFFIDVEDTNGEKQEVEPSTIKFKAFVVIEKPPEHKGKKFGGVFAMRTYDPYVLDLGDHLAVNSTEHYNLGKFQFPQDGGAEEFEAWRENSRADLVARKQEYAQDALDAAAEFYGLDWIKNAKVVDVKMATQPYLPRDEEPTLNQGAERGKEIHELTSSPKGGVYMRVLGAKLTTIPLAAMEAVIQIVQPLVDRGLLNQEDIDRHIKIDPETKMPFVSEELKNAMLVNEPAPNLSPRKTDAKAKTRAG